jgi:hypothetical protein
MRRFTICSLAVFLSSVAIWALVAAYRDHESLAAFAAQSMRVGVNREEVITAARKSGLNTFELNNGVTIQHSSGWLGSLIRFQIEVSFGEDHRLLSWK